MTGRGTVGNNALTKTLNKHSESDGERQRERDRERDRERVRERERERQRQRERENVRERERQRQRERENVRERESQRESQRESERERDRERGRERVRERETERERDRESPRESERDRERERDSVPTYILLVHLHQIREVRSREAIFLLQSIKKPQGIVMSENRSQRKITLIITNNCLGSVCPCPVHVTVLTLPNAWPLQTRTPLHGTIHRPQVVQL